MFLNAIGVLLVVVALCGAALLFFITRADTYQELEILLHCDFVVGLWLAGGYFLTSISGPDKMVRGRNSWRMATCLLLWAGLSGLLMADHVLVARIRFHNPRATTSNRIKMTELALEQYFEDCGTFPSQEQGLESLRRDPGVPKWAGPYLEDKDLVDSWGHPLLYELRDDLPRVWSAGRDGVSGTSDDVSLESERRRLGG
ncbi:type II secretion system protein GspG [Fimbriiglobus ruber]|uniref:Type II secretion system protein GspG C-terminal domain-containing protein n=1 Tax=Fimbriiglobus ruber TaxID=1908690 RepID=A0A225DWZ5_9BACT|nr:type II secretion system protein GspG [Fimbriiglobus ruber]OWK43008.1 hypothetical protein FRUB_02607 [Fimbriiglobus ruber]